MFWATLFALAAASPAVSQSQVAPVDSRTPGVDTQAPNPNSGIAPLDHLDVVVFREPDLSVQDVVVSESGEISLPLIGQFTAAGKSTEVLSTEVTAKLRAYVYYPKVSITVTQPASRRVTVAGSVVQPGVYPMDGRMTLLQTVALARGPSRVAAMNQAFIFRTRDGQRVARRFDLDAIAKGKAADPEVISGDTVTVGSSGFKTAWRDILDTVSSFSIWRVLP